MTTWEAFLARAREKYKLAESEDEFALVVAFDDGRTQNVVVNHFQAYDQSWLKLSSTVCRSDEMSPKVALRKNWDFAAGYLTLDETGFYKFTFTAPISLLTPESFDLILHVLARTADRLEKDYSSGDDDY